MWKVLVALACVILVILAVAGGIAAAFYSSWRFRRLSGRKTPTVCISCQGKGWITKHPRTLHFDGDGFVDGETRSQRCEACDGTGVIYR